MGRGLAQTGLSRAGLRIRWEARTLLGRWPWSARRFIRRSGNPITSETDIVIEGFPRTGNTFAVTAFVDAQPGFVSVAHHVHVPAQVLEAVRRDVPCVVLIRRPEDTVLSLVVRLPHLGVRQALRSYARFYEPLLPIRDRFVTATFDQVISDFGEVVSAVNTKYGTTFVPFDHAPDNVIRIMEQVDRSDRGAFGDDVEAMERGRARPTPAREALKSRQLATYESDRLASHRARAEAAYLGLAEG